MAWIGFMVIALVILTSALQVVRSTNLVHTVFWLAGALMGTAALFVHLHADFLAAVQVLLYTGGVITLMLFGVMLTRRLSGIEIQHGSKNVFGGIAVATALLGLIAMAINKDPLTRVATADAFIPDTEALGALFLTDLMLPFELLSILLLAAMIGAITLARKVDP
jgi:NADH:ubiquinone oxidoreductase subunit 6 (subunit J)